MNTITHPPVADSVAAGGSGEFRNYGLIGVGFGFALERAGFGSSRRLAGVFYFRDMAVIGLAATLLIFPTESVATSANGGTAVTQVGSLNLADNQLLASIESANDHIGPEQVADRLLRGDAGLMLVDVRPADEYDQFHIRGAQNIRVSEVLNQLEPYRNLDTIVLYSNGMTHHAQARDMLAMHSFTNVYQMTDGLQGFLDHCVRPVSLRDAPASEEVAKLISINRQYFLADSTCTADSLASLKPNQLESLNVGSIAKLHTVDGIFLSSQPFPDDFQLLQNKTKEH